MESIESTRVEIFGSEYSVRRSNAEPEYVRDVATYVNEKMTAIAQTQSLVSSMKVAILAAMDLADEVMQERKKQEQIVDDVAVKARQLADLLAREL